MNLCAERVAALNMYASSGQTRIKRLIAFRDKAPFGNGSGMPCGACREFLYQLNAKNESMEIMVDYKSRETVTLKDLLPDFWGKELNWQPLFRQISSEQEITFTTALILLFSDCLIPCTLLVLDNLVSREFSDYYTSKHTLPILTLTLPMC